MASTLMASGVIERIRRQVGSSWLGATNESFESGTGDLNVSGIATTWTPSIEALQIAIAVNHNFIISVVSPFRYEAGTVKTEVSYGSPSMKQMESSPAFQFKKKLIDDHGLAIWRFYENYLALPANPRLNALANALGYTKL